MRSTSNSAAALVGLAVLAGSVGAQQQRTVVLRDTVSGGKTLEVRMLSGNVEELLKEVMALQEREQSLIRRLQSSPVADISTRRSLNSELQTLSREAFALMSVIESRCIAERSGAPAGYLGVNLTSDIDALSGEITRSVVESIEPGSPAARAGLARGDLVLTIAGESVGERLPELGKILEPGRRISIGVHREGRPMTFHVTAVRRPGVAAGDCGQFERALQPLRLAGPGRLPTITAAPAATEPRRGTTVRATPVPAQTPAVSEVSTASAPRSVFVLLPAQSGSEVSFFGGAEFRLLTPDWRDALAVPSDIPGVLVSAVAAGSPASQAGLRGGDVVTSVDNTGATSPSVLVRLLSVNSDRPSTISVRRGKDGRTISLRLNAQTP